MSELLVPTAYVHLVPTEDVHLVPREDVHPIEKESYEILRTRFDLSHLGPLSAAVAARVLHATADVQLADSMVLDEKALEAGVEALRQGADVAVDVEMVRAGITTYPTKCYLSECCSGEPRGDLLSSRAESSNDLSTEAPLKSDTRCGRAMRLACERHPEGAVFVVGCAPTAVSALIEMFLRKKVAPAFVIGLPVGLVGAAESKEALRMSGLPCATNIGERGGSAAAVAAFNALWRAAGTGRRATAPAPEAGSKSTARPLEQGAGDG